MLSSLINICATGAPTFTALVGKRSGARQPTSVCTCGLSQKRLRHAKSYLKQSIKIFQRNVAAGDNKVDLLVSQKTVFPDLNRPELNCSATSFTDNPIVADS